MIDNKCFKCKVNPTIRTCSNCNRNYCNICSEFKNSMCEICSRLHTPNPARNIPPKSFSDYVTYD